MASEKIGSENLSVPARHSLCIVLIIALAGMWYWIYQKPRDERLASVKSKNEKLLADLRQTEIVEAEHAQYQKDPAETDRRLTVLQTVVPTPEEAAAFLKTVQDMAISSGLRINLFRPKTLVPHDFYYDLPVEIRLEGNYHGLGRFFEKISRSPRLAGIPEIAVNSIRDQTDPERTITAAVTLTAYVRGELPARRNAEE